MKLTPSLPRFLAGLALALCLVSHTLTTHAADSPVGLKTVITALDDTNSVMVIVGDGTTAVVRRIAKTNFWDAIKLSTVRVDNLVVGGTLQVTNLSSFLDDMQIDASLDVDDVVVNGTTSTVGAAFVNGMIVPASNLTNYTLTATFAERTLNLTNHARFTLLTATGDLLRYFPCITITNFSGSAWSLNFTNTWKAYGTTTNSIADGKTCRVCFEVDEANVRYSLTTD